jgi:TctA family transporter
MAAGSRQRVGHGDRHPARLRRGHGGLDVLRNGQEILQGAGEIRHRPCRGHRGIGAANNSSLAGAWIPAIVFGIPGDSITAIAIGVLYLKGMNPGPTIFLNNPQNIYAIFLVFILANIIMIPLGWLAIKAAKNVLRVSRNILMPSILLFCIVGSFAINNTVFGVVLILTFGLIAFVLEENGFPVAPAILGVVLGQMMEENFITSMIKSDGNVATFFTRPIAMGLAAATFVILLWPVGAWLWRSRPGATRPSS